MMTKKKRKNLVYDIRTQADATKRDSRQVAKTAQIRRVGWRAEGIIKAIRPIFKNYMSPNVGERVHLVYIYIIM